ncbi:hypothetical protein CEUSTIGMA_g502.t1 [Chlamydomonas eustigma]|uniref:Uncharacterized protein n=1 Tax=Chlamydomonas eustigma TaxID=1157962 RepID=A0A250WQS8_9CHLO|nr:hypothetical protein CEUSTIGMA_g502.t1 [Chlamydomonas eustigma]|eukprot:GAX73049.1 hypothetical protein CEUSTIGMA_g502.t1 [Chlamydomonas eustigma]
MVQSDIKIFLEMVPQGDAKKLDLERRIAHFQYPVSKMLLEREKGCKKPESIRLAIENLCSFRQIASVCPKDKEGRKDQTLVTSLAVRQHSGQIAWTQADGVFRLVRMDRLYSAAISSGRQKLSEAYDAEDRLSDKDVLTRMRVLPTSISDVVCPSFKLGDRLDDVSWDSHTPSTMAFASSSNKLTVLDLSKVPYTYLRLHTPKHPNSRISKVKFLLSGQLAGSDRQAIHLWDLRKGPASISHFSASESLASPAEALPGTNLLCAVTVNQKLLLWDLRKLGSNSSVMLFGTSGPSHHALISNIDLQTPIAAALTRMTSPDRSWFSNCGGGGVPAGQLHRVPWVIQVVANPQHASMLGMVMQSGGSAIFDINAQCVQSLALATGSFHAATTTRDAKIGFAGAWGGSGTRFWSTASFFEDSEPWTESREDQNCLDEEMVVDQPGVGYITSHPISRDPASSSTSILNSSDSNRRLRCSSLLRQEAGILDPIQHAHKCAFKIASRIPGLGDVVEALNEAGAQPSDLLTNPTTSSLCIDARDRGLLRHAVRIWEDARRRVHGPATVVALDAWPTCMACHLDSNTVLMGTSAGTLSVVQPFRLGK